MISLFRVFSVCYSDMHFVNFSPVNQIFVEYKLRNMFQISELLLTLDTKRKVMKESFIEYLGLNARKPVSVVSDKARLKPACSATETS